MFPENRFFEILIIGAVALIFIGPKDLPIVMRRVGQFVGKMRGMAAEFRASFDELARQSELEELRKEVEALRSSHDTALGEIHASLDNSMGGAFGETTPSFMMPLNPPTPTPIEGAEDLRPASAPQPEAATPAKPARKPRKSPAKTPDDIASSAIAKAPARPKPGAAAKSPQADEPPPLAKAKRTKIVSEGT